MDLEKQTGKVPTRELSGPTKGQVRTTNSPCELSSTCPGSFEFDPTYRYVSALPAQGVESYSTMDVHLGWRCARQFELSFVGNNLFQPQHAEFGGDSGGAARDQEKHLRGKITWTSDGK